MMSAMSALSRGSSRLAVLRPLLVAPPSTTRTFTSAPSIVHIPIADALHTATRALERLGWNHGDAKLQAEIMVHAELCGNNQGLVKLYQPQQMQPAPNRHAPEILRETPQSAVVDARQSPGMLAAVTAADMAVTKLQDNDHSAISIVSSFNSSTSSGQLGYYVERIAQHNLIGLGCCNSPEFVSAAPGGKPVFGTNPLAVSVPVAGEHPFTVRTCLFVFLLQGVVKACGSIAFEVFFFLLLLTSTNFSMKSISFFSSIWQRQRWPYLVCLVPRRPEKPYQTTSHSTNMEVGRPTRAKF